MNNELTSFHLPSTCVSRDVSLTNVASQSVEEITSVVIFNLHVYSYENNVSTNDVIRLQKRIVQEGNFLKMSSVYINRHNVAVC